MSAWLARILAQTGNGTRRSLSRWNHALILLRTLLHFEMRDLGIDLRPEFIGGAPQLSQKLSRLARNLRQLLRPKDNEGQYKQEDSLGETHAPIIMRERKKRQCVAITEWIAAVENPSRTALR